MRKLGARPTTWSGYRDRLLAAFVVVVVFVSASMLATTGCDDRSYREIGASIDVLTKKKQDLPGPAIERLRKIGRLIADVQQVPGRASEYRRPVGQHSPQV